MSSKTRDKLIDVARQLFIRNGVENTTIGDIASASDKGRRTIYTYFKNKREIYRAVVDRESEQIVSSLRAIADSDRAPADKLRAFFDVRYHQSPSFSSSTSSIKSLLVGDFHRTANIRNRTYEKEENILFQILDEGIEQGDFDAEKCSLLRNFAYRLIVATDLLMLHDDYPQLDSSNGVAIIEFIIQSISK